MAKLWIGHPNYSSWSLRGWLACKIAGVETDIQWIRFKDTSWHAQVPSRQTVPALDLGGTWVWDSLAIGEMLADDHPHLWPEDRAAKAHARSIVAEMHSGFMSLRGACPMNIRGRAPDFPMTQEIFDDISRVQDLLEGALEHFGGTYLYGDEITLADAFYAPVIYRLRTYAPPAHCELADYSERLLSHDLLREWEALAEDDQVLDHYDRLLANI